jgi:DNA-directed RNA polymerase subunit RPC12/RpoP
MVSEIVILLPCNERVCQICLNAGNGNFMALNINDEISHIQHMHKDKGIVYKCTNCQKIYKSKHGAQCHMPKFRGPNLVAEVDRILRCNSCNKTFDTKVDSLSMIGTSTHLQEMRQG